MIGSVSYVYNYLNFIHHITRYFLKLFFNEDVYDDLTSAS